MSEEFCAYSKSAFSSLNTLRSTLYESQWLLKLSNEEIMMPWETEWLLLYSEHTWKSELVNFAERQDVRYKRKKLEKTSAGVWGLSRSRMGLPFAEMWHLQAGSLGVYF